MTTQTSEPLNRFDCIINRAETNAIKKVFCEPLFGRRDLIPLWVADMDFPAPQAVTDELIKRAQHPIYGYTARPKSYFESLQNWMHTRHQWSIKTEWCLHSPTVLASLSLALDTLAPLNSDVVIQTPVYAPFYTVVTRNNRNIVENPLLRRPDGSYQMDFNHLELCFAKGAKFFILCSPHNPVGRVWTKTELSRLAEIIIRYNVTVLSDEIHCDLVFSGHKHTPLASVSSDLRNNVITCVSPTKTFNLAGMSTSAIIVSNPKLRQQIEAAFLRYSIDHTNLFGVVAFESAFRNGAEWLDELLKYLECNRDFIAQFLSQFPNKVTVKKPEGTYLAWLDFAASGWDEKEISHKLIHEAGLALEPGAKFGSAATRFSRLNFACPRSILEQAVVQFEKILR